ncbi:MAG TPA: periplasmic heavy metal sensor [Candidatus Binatia bacterium]
MKKSRLVLVGLTLMTLCSVVARAQPLGAPPMTGHGHARMFGDSGAMMLPLVLKHAKLTPEQTKQVQTIMETDRQALRTLFTQLEAANGQLSNKLFAAGTVQAADLTPQVQQISQLRQQLMEQGVKTALSIRAILTPEQLAKVSQLNERIQKLHAEMRSIFEAND